MREKTAVVTSGGGDRLPAEHREEELLVVALAAALVEYKKCVGNGACRHEQVAKDAEWRTIGRWEQLAGARRA